MSDHVHRPMWPPRGFRDSAPCADCGEMLDLRVCLDAIEAHQRIAKDEHEAREQARAEVERLRALLKKIAPAIGELHAQGIGCPDCRHDADEPVKDPFACDLIDLIDAAAQPTAEEAEACRRTPGPCTCGAHKTELGDWKEP